MNSIRVSWRKPDDQGASKIIDYVVYYKTREDEKQFQTSELSVLIKGLRADTEYFIWVVARNGQGHSIEPWSGLNVFTLAPSKSLLVNNIQFLYLQFLQLPDFFFLILTFILSL